MGRDGPCGQRGGGPGSRSRGWLPFKFRTDPDGLPRSPTDDEKLRLSQHDDTYVREVDSRQLTLSTLACLAGRVLSGLGAVRLLQRPSFSGRRLNNHDQDSDEGCIEREQGVVRSGAVRQIATVVSATQEDRGTRTKGSRSEPRTVRETPSKKTLFLFGSLAPGALSLRLGGRSLSVPCSLVGLRYVMRTQGEAMQHGLHFPLPA